mmetsp:Transcript_1916/g.4856  ORF Transcript_1916/g.4856 Transcript_1916/m.4856 type:complete len:288 (-) Transcript_1916:1105-1968(-)
MQRAQADVCHICRTDGLSNAVTLVKHERLVASRLIHQQAWSDHCVAQATHAQVVLPTALRAHHALHIQLTHAHTRSAAGTRHQHKVGLLATRQRLDPVNLQVEAGQAAAAWLYGKTLCCTRSRHSRRPACFIPDSYMLHRLRIQGWLPLLGCTESVVWQPHRRVGVHTRGEARIVPAIISGKYAGVDVAIPAHAQRQALRVGSPLVPTRQLLLHGCTYLCEGIPLDERALESKVLLLSHKYIRLALGCELVRHLTLLLAHEVLRSATENDIPPQLVVCLAEICNLPL